MTITKIFHISDLHIFEKNYVNLRHSWGKLLLAITTQPDYQKNICLVITGDVFEYKTYLNSDDVHLFYEMINQLEKNKIKTIIIPGNHDYNINSLTAKDNISILLSGTKHKYVRCFSTTDVYEYENLKFWVYSPIDKQIPKDTTANNTHTNIALLHEPIIDSRFDNGELITSGRFKLSDIVAANHHIVMLGDIHRPQMLAPNIGYAGSFVQKNKGEGLNHGYILWDVLARTGKHIWIPQKEVSLKLVAVADKLEQLPQTDSKITNITFIHKNCSHQWLQATIDLIKQTYSIPINQIIRQDTSIGDLDKLNVSAKITSGCPTNLSHSDLIRDILTKGKKTDDQTIQKVIDLHNKFLQNRTTIMAAQYKIKYLIWSNVFCYGPNNYINFEEAKGLVAINGYNKTGKSSVIDILIRILFNECERGYKDDILNKNGKKTGFIKCCFMIGDSEYVIEQSWEKYSTSSTHRLWKDGKNITKDSIVKTYKYIKEDLGLGDYKNFINLTTALQNRQSIVDLDKKNLYNLFCGILNIDTLRDIEEYIKKERDFLKREKKLKLKDIEQLGFANIDEKEWTFEYDSIKNQNTDLLNKQAEYKDILNNLNEAKCEINRNIQQVDLPEGWQPKELKLVELPWSTEEQFAKKAKLNELIIEFELAKKKYMDIKSEKPIASGNKLKQYCASLGIDQIDEVALNQMKEMAGKQKWAVAKFKTKYSYEELERMPTCEYDLAELYGLIKPCDQANIIEMDEPATTIQELKDRLEKLKSAARNYKIFKAQYRVSQEANEIMRAAGLECQYAPIFEKYKIQYTSAKEFRNGDEADILKAIDYNEQYEQVIKNNHIITTNAEIKSRIQEAIEYKNAMEDLDNWQLVFENDKIDLATEALREYIGALSIEEMGQLKEQLLALKKDIGEYKNDIQNWEIAEATIIENSNYRNNLNKYSIRLNNAVLEQKLIELNHEYKIADNDLAELTKNILINTEKLNNLDNIYSQYMDLKAKISELDNIINLYDIYYNCINYKTGIPSAILRHTCIMLSEQCNKILSAISDFLVEFVFDEDIKIYTIYKKNNNDIRVLAAMGSGFQKFILDMIMRIILTKLSNISNPNILFIDEGFGSLDEKNFNSICFYLNKLKDNFATMFIITQKAELKSYMDMNINITIDVADDSQLIFGKLANTDLNLEFRNKLQQHKDKLENNTDEKIHIEPEQPEDTFKKDIAILYNLNIGIDGDIDTDEILSEVANKYHCGICNKSFKTILAIKKHYLSKTYKNKHIPLFKLIKKN